MQTFYWRSQDCLVIRLDLPGVGPDDVGLTVQEKIEAGNQEALQSWAVCRCSSRYLANVQATLRVRGPRKARALDLRDLRVAGTAMVGLAAVWPVLPLHPGFACPLRMVTGIPCPLCGMTTSVVHTVHLHLDDAVAANFAGPLAVGFALWLLLRRPQRVKIHPAFVVLLLLAMWLFELRRFAVL